jgi:hypothetical protein
MAFADWSRRITAAALFVLSVSVSLAVQQGVAAIGGAVLDTTGRFLEFQSVSPIQDDRGNQQTVTDKRGTDHFLRLVPGRTSSVRAELTGYSATLTEQLMLQPSEKVAPATLKSGIHHECCEMDFRTFTSVGYRRLRGADTSFIPMHQQPEVARVTFHAGTVPLYEYGLAA